MSAHKRYAEWITRVCIRTIKAKLFFSKSVSCIVIHHLDLEVELLFYSIAIVVKSLLLALWYDLYKTDIYWQQTWLATVIAYHHSLKKLHSNYFLFEK